MIELRPELTVGEPSAHLENANEDQIERFFQPCIDGEADLSVRGGETYAAAATGDRTEPRGGNSTGGRDDGSDSDGSHDASTHGNTGVTGEPTEIESKGRDREIVGELVTAITVLENAARADVAVAPPDSPMHLAAQRQLYVIDLVQDCLDGLDSDLDQPEGPQSPPSPTGPAGRSSEDDHDRLADTPH